VGAVMLVEQIQENGSVASVAWWEIVGENSGVSKDLAESIAAAQAALAALVCRRRNRTAPAE